MPGGGPPKHKPRCTGSPRGSGRSRWRRVSFPARSGLKEPLIQLETEPVLQLERQFSRIGEMCPPEGVAVVQHVVVVSKIEGAEAQIPVLAERFADREIDRGMSGQVSRPSAVEESRARVHLAAGPELPGELEIQASA